MDLHAYVFTLESMTDALVELRKQDRQIRVILSKEPGKRNVYDPYQDRQMARLKEAGALVASGLSIYDGILHGKYGVVDGTQAGLYDRLPSTCAFHGSYNFSAAAQNQGNHLTVEHQPEDISPWESEFEREWLRLYVS